MRKEEIYQKKYEAQSRLLASTDQLVCVVDRETLNQIHLDNAPQGIFQLTGWEPYPYKTLAGCQLIVCFTTVGLQFYRK